MCKWNNTETVKLQIPQAVSKRNVCEVDSCIVEIVQALNDGGVLTIASCCGHGKGIGNIALRDGRELFIVPDYETARELNEYLDNSLGE